MSGQALVSRISGGMVLGGLSTALQVGRSAKTVGYFESFSHLKKKRLGGVSIGIAKYVGAIKLL